MLCSRFLGFCTQRGQEKLIIGLLIRGGLQRRAGTSRGIVKLSCVPATLGLSWNTGVFFCKWLTDPKKFHGCFFTQEK